MWNIFPLMVLLVHESTCEPKVQLFPSFARMQWYSINFLVYKVCLFGRCLLPTWRPSYENAVTFHITRTKWWCNTPCPILYRRFQYIPSVTWTHNLHKFCETCVLKKISCTMRCRVWLFHGLRKDLPVRAKLWELGSIRGRKMKNP